MTLANEIASKHIGDRALSDLTARDLVRIDPFPDLIENQESTRRGSRSQITLGAHLGISLSRAARRRIRDVGSCSSRQLLETAISGGALRDAHCLQMEASYRIWSSPTSIAPEEVRRALLQLPRNTSGIGTSLERLWSIGEARPWFKSADDSFGFGGVPRCIGITEVISEGRRCAAMADMAITHAHPLATWSSAALSELLVMCRDSEAVELPAAINELLDILSGTPLRHTARVVREMGSGPIAEQIQSTYRGATCESALIAAFGSAQCSEQPSFALASVAASGAPSAVMAVVGAVIVARSGTNRFPEHWVTPIEEAIGEMRSSYKASSVPRSKRGQVLDVQQDHIWVLLDRSGSMQGISGVMESGFDHFIAQQSAVSDHPTKLTLVQFDDRDPHEVVLDSVALDEIPSLSGILIPRGRTPLYDAIDLLLNRAQQAPRVGEQQLVVIITDGLENSSQLANRRQIFERISRLEDEGWTFVYLGANQDSYSECNRMSIANGNASNFEFSERGVSRMYEGLDRATREWRGKDRTNRSRDRRDFWGGHREAEDLK